MPEEENNWSIELTLKVKGPKEGPVIVKVEYPSTTRAMAEALQNKLAALAIDLNANGIK